MSENPTQNNGLSLGDVNRRDFLRLSGLATAGVLATACGAPAAAPADGGGDAAADGGGEAAPAAGEVAQIAREKSLILMFGGGEGQFGDVGIAGMYAAGTSGHRSVPGSFEPLFFYSAFSDEFLPWLATGYEYSDDFTQLTVNIREGAEWSDGTPFSAEDVRFTLQMLIDEAPTLRNSTEVAAWISSVEAVDDLTVVINFNDPRPRFLFSHLTGKFDTGLYWVPAHVYQDVEDVQGFAFYDPEKGWPLVTGPYNVTLWTPEQQFVDRRDDWWGAKTGFSELPDVERIIHLPWTGEERAAQLIINNEIDSSLDLRATTIATVVDQSEAVITHTNRDLPLGYTDWWPTSFWFNCDEGPFSDKNVRWAVSYTIDRQQMLDVALEGSGILTQLPFPYYPPLMPYIDAAAELLEEYPTNEHNLDKAAERMTEAGYEKDDEGFWVKDGERVPAVIHGFGIFNDIGPVLAEQLRRGGFEGDYVAPADSFTKMSDGTAKILLFGHGASIADPFDTLDLYTSKHYAPTGEPANPFSRFQSEEYDAILEEMAAMEPSPDDPKYMELYLSALRIYLDEMIDCPIQQWLHRMPMNTTFWDNWPTVDNPYVNGAFWHQTVILLLQGLKSKA
ncbi:MAG: ABC transporter substrate-binding protein [Chloroflexota bacterium]